MNNLRVIVAVCMNDKVVGYHTGKFKSMKSVDVPIVVKDPMLAKRYPTRMGGKSFGDVRRSIIDRSHGVLCGVFVHLDLRDGEVRA